MTDQPTPRTDIVKTAIGHKYTQFNGAPIMEAIIASYAVQAQELENVFVNLWVLRVLDNAENAQLDTLGKIVGEPRQGRDDDDYRLAIRARVLSNRSNASVEDILAVLKATDDKTYQIKDLGFASMLIEMKEAIGSTNPQEINDIIQRIKAGGVSASFVYNSSGQENALTLASGDTVESSATQGLSNDAGTSGGKLVSVLE